jgi:FkbH-like protein
MYESEFGNERIWRREIASPGSFTSRLNLADVEAIQLLYWREHCLECSPPECYGSCPLYLQRLDRRCVRFDYGIVRNEHFTGLQGYGADLRFRRWAKLETELYGSSLRPATHNRLGKVDVFLSNLMRGIGTMSAGYRPSQWLKRRPYNPQRQSFKAFAKLRQTGLHALETIAPARVCDLFVMECYSFGAHAYNMIVEYADGQTRGRVAINIQPGHNYQELTVQQLGAQPGRLTGKLSVYPENDAEVRVVFTWLDFVKKSPKSVSSRTAGVPARRSEEKVKCLAWDLDNTLWTGVLIEDGRDKIRVRPEAIETIKELDRRGVIQTIVSKNEFDSTWAVLGELGLQEYFIYPAINWAPKSTNIAEIARKINIGVDSIVLIDDSPFERAEVSETLPAVRVYPDADICRLVSMPEFDLPVTEMSALRRRSYLTEMAREQVREAHGEDYENFLRSCEMVLRIVVPAERSHRERCWELLQRSNQLNLSSRRYTHAEFEALLQKEGHLCVALECADRFGAYGIVGFASIDEARAVPELVDFAMSCRVAQKRIEHAFFQWVAVRQREVGKRALHASLRRTNKNGPLVDVFTALPFRVVGENENRIELEASIEDLAAYEPIVRVIADADPVHAIK